MDQFLNCLKARGYKITPQRRAVIAALLASGRFATAQQISEAVKKTNPEISLDTVYRNLSLFVELGIVYEIHTRSREGILFEAASSGHHCHMICIGCKKTECLDLCPVNETLAAAAEAKGFEITSHSFEFYGLCRACKKK